MTSARNSTYSTHSVADAHLLALLEEKQDTGQINDKGSRFSTLFPARLLETILIIPSSVSRRHEDDTAEDRSPVTSFNDMQRSVQIIGLPKPAKSKPRLSHHFEAEHIIDHSDATIDNPAQGPDYDSEPQMQYLAPGRSNEFTPEYRQQGCGYRHPTYYGGPCGRVGYCGYGRGYGGPQRPPQAYFPGGRRQRRYGGGYYYGAGGCGYGRGGYAGCGPYYTQRPMLVRRHGGFCCCC
ncbi:unnamed protein product [Aureobasidium mustum]|uniref:Uncharacterized protein n=1 Tax=Aureobasidium mustum TaxID=2773714 RepID=A0A9N8K9L9_9PEZI|nr:unnamed protein product [Aureobasidium mustum]